MMRLRYLVLVVAAHLLIAPLALAFHVAPWDTGHQTFDPDSGVPQTDPGSDSPCKTASPVEVSSGNFVHQLPVFKLAGLGPEIDFTLVYNSLDLRKGAFGTGWTHAYEERVVVTTDGSQIFAIDCSGNGKRGRFSRGADGTYVPPPYTFLSLVRQSDGTSILRDKYGQVKVFDADGKLSRIVDRNGNAVSLAYDQAGFLTTITSASGRSLRFTKGANGRVASMTDPASHTFVFTYDSSANLIKVTDALGQAWSFQHDSSSLMSSVIDPRGNAQIGIVYDSNRRVQRLTERAETWTYAYQAGQTSKTDSSGNKWVMDYNAAGSITKKTDPLGKSVSYTYDSQFDTTSYTDQNGNITKYTYDALGNLLSTADALGNTRTIAYEPVFNLPTVLTDPLANTTQLAYDSHGNLVSVTDPSGSAITQLQYDVKGQLVKVIDPLGGITTLVYDTFGNVNSVTEPGKSAATATFDILGELLTATDPRGDTYQYAYDAAQRLNRTTNPNGASVVRQYDVSGNLAMLTLPNTGSFTFSYDAFNRLTQMSNPLKQTTTYQYDKHDNVMSSTDPLGRQTGYVYDDIDRLVTKRLAHASVSYSYDAAGNLLSVANASSTLTFVVDVLNRLVRTTATPQNATVSYTYDAAGRTLTINDGGGAIQYVYNHRSLITSITDFDGFATGFLYDLNQRRTIMSRTGGFSTNYTYDAANRLLTLSSTGPAGPLSFAYTYDGADNRIALSDANGNHSYVYNKRDYLTSATHPTATNPAESYSYDTDGNRTASHLSATYTYDLANRMTADERFDYAYDAAGNPMTRKQRGTTNVRSYEYDDENRITRITFINGTFATYLYDGLGRRYEKTTGGQTTRYVYAGATILKEVDSNGVTLARYTPGINWDETLAVRRGGATSVFETDGLGSVIRTVAGGKANATFEYDSFGNAISQTGTPQAAYAFQGRELDAESRLYYYRARYYEPQVGRFLTADPVGFRGGTNFYVFVDNNPTTRSEASRR